MCKEWRNTSKCAEPAKSGSQGVGGAKALSVVSRLWNVVFGTYAHARLLGCQRASYPRIPRRMVPMGPSQDEQFSLQAPADLPSSSSDAPVRDTEACGSARAALAKVDPIRAASDVIMVGVPHTAYHRVATQSSPPTGTRSI